MSEHEWRAHCCCFTGHRPEKLHISQSDAKDILARHARAAANEGYKTFISGMARGVDIWAAEAVLSLRKECAEIRLICALPFPDFQKRCDELWKREFESILQASDCVHVVCPAFSMRSYQLRNEWMVDHSSMLIAIYNGGAGGTKNTIEYAKKKGRRIVIANDTPAVHNLLT